MERDEQRHVRPIYNPRTHCPTEAAAAELEQAGPAPSSYTESHDVLREATEKLQLALTRFLTYLDSGSRNETALVDANVALNQYKRLSDRYNELVG